MNIFGIYTLFIIISYISYISGTPVVPQYAGYSYQIQKLFKSANLTTENLLNKIYSSSNKSTTTTTTIPQVTSTTKSKSTTTVKPASGDTNSIPIDLFFTISTTPSSTTTTKATNTTQRPDIREKSSTSKLKTIRSSNASASRTTNLINKHGKEKISPTVQTSKRHVQEEAKHLQSTSSNAIPSDTFKIQSGHIQVRSPPPDPPSPPFPPLPSSQPADSKHTPSTPQDVATAQLPQCVINVLPSELKKKEEKASIELGETQSKPNLITAGIEASQRIEQAKDKESLQIAEHADALPARKTTSTTTASTTATTPTTTATTTTTTTTTATTPPLLRSSPIVQNLEPLTTTPPLTDTDFYTMVTDALLVVVSEKLQTIGPLSVELKPGLVFAIGSLGYIMRGGPVSLRHAKDGRQRIIETNIMVGPLSVGPGDDENQQSHLRFYLKGDLEIRLKRNMQRHIVLHLSELDVGSTQEQIYLIDGIKRLATSGTYELIKDFLLQINFEEILSESIKEALSMDSIHKTFTAIPEFLPQK